MIARIYRSRIVLPIASPPIEDGAVIVIGRHIRDVGRFSDCKKWMPAKIYDLGASILLPGLINCHCHLDYTEMAGQIAPQRHFTDWLKKMIAIKASWSRADFARSWRRGARMLEKSGTTTLIDIESIPQLLPEMWQTTPMRIWSCLELIDIHSSQNVAECISETMDRSRRLESKTSNQCGLSPHALYTTSDSLRHFAAQLARTDRRLLTTHIAESREEFDLFCHRRGALYDWLKMQTAHIGEGSPISILEKTGYLRSLNLAVHANELAKGDASRLAKHKVSVVHCPQSHRYFGHRRFDWKRLADAGVNLTLGTDSLASIEENDKNGLSLFCEMACLASQKDAPSPSQILSWATANGAIAIHRQRQLGRIESGFLADLIAIPYSGSIDRACEGILTHQGNVRLSIIGGIQIAHCQDDLKTLTKLDENESRKALTK